jgi:hypothetical protein
LFACFEVCSRRCRSSAIDLFNAASEDALRSRPVRVPRRAARLARSSPVRAERRTLAPQRAPSSLSRMPGTKTSEKSWMTRSRSAIEDQTDEN